MLPNRFGWSPASVSEVLKRLPEGHLLRSLLQQIQLLQQMLVPPPAKEADAGKQPPRIPGMRFPGWPPPPPWKIPLPSVPVEKKAAAPTGQPSGQPPPEKPAPAEVQPAPPAEPAEKWQPSQDWQPSASWEEFFSRWSKVWGPPPATRTDQPARAAAPPPAWFVAGIASSPAGIEASQPHPQSVSSPLKEELLIKSIKLHEAAVAGDKEAVDQAYQMLERLRNIDPDDPLVEAFYGSTITLLARDALDPRERLAKGLQGHRLLSRAVERDPHNLWARVLRAFVSYRLPEEFFHRTHIAIEDFNYLVSRYQQDASIFTPQFYWEILYHLGCAYRTIEQNQEAEDVWSRLWRETDDPRYRELLEREGFKPPAESAAAGGAEAADIDSHHPRPAQDPAPSAAAEKKPVLTIPAIEARLSPDVPAEPEQKALPPAPPLTAVRKAAYELVDREQLKEGVELHARAREGDPEAARRAYEFFEKLRTAYPNDDLAAAYCADCLSMTARTADAATQFSSAISAIQTLEKAVGRRPDDLEIRLLRGYHSFRLPQAFFRRTPTAIEDFEYLIQRWEQDPSLLPRETYWQLLFDLGTAYQRLDREEEARAVWEKLLSLDPDPKYRELVQRQEFDLNGTVEKLTQIDDPNTLLQEGIRLFKQGVDGNPKAAKAAHQALQRASQLDPENLEI